MALKTHATHPAPLPQTAPLRAPKRAPAHWGVRGGIVALAAFIALSAILGAIYVVPTMPLATLHQGVLNLFSDYTIPALALGVVCGGLALVALVLTPFWPRAGAVAAVAAGGAMVIFELVEILVVGFTAAMTPTQPAAWLQIVYLLAGGALAYLGARLWSIETAPRPPLRAA